MPKVHRLLVAGAALLVVCLSAGVGLAAASTTHSNVVTGPDHERLAFTLKPGGSYTFTLPAANDPLQIDIDHVSTNGGLQSPSELFSALLNVDSNGAGMSWIGTNSNGSETGNNSSNTANITNEYCGPSSCVVASLYVGNVLHRTVRLKATKNSGVKETFVINIWY